MNITRLKGVGGAVWNASYLKQLEKLGEAILNRKTRRRLKDLLAVNKLDEAAALLHRAISKLFEEDTFSAEEATMLYGLLWYSPDAMASWREQRMKDDYAAAVEAAWEKIGDDFQIVRFH